MGDKTIADCCEALIGAAFFQYNKPGEWKAADWDAAVAAVTVFVKDHNHNQRNWTDYIAAYRVPEYLFAEVTAAQKHMAEKVEQLHPYHFKSPRLLRCAFNHPSNPTTWDKIPSYQRLEFLGDSLLDMACVSYLYYTFEYKDPQWLTEHKTAMVANKFLGAVCVRIGFHAFLQHCNATLDSQIRGYVTEISEAAESSGGVMDYWVSSSDPPKVSFFESMTLTLAVLIRVSVFPTLSKLTSAPSSSTQASTIA
jgi:endoribonuclease Dicer